MDKNSQVINPQDQADADNSEVENLEGQIIVRAEVLKRIDDSFDQERNWRKAGQQIQDIYKGKLSSYGSKVKGVTFNSLNSNVSILLPSLISSSPRPAIEPRSAVPTPQETSAALALQKTTEVFMKLTPAYESIKSAVKEVLLPGRGTVRVRWDPIVESSMQPDPMDPMGAETMVHEKLLDQLAIEHVYWEDFTHELTANWETVGWVAFRHLFTEKKFLSNFANTPAVQKLIRQGRLSDIFKWTDRSAAQLSSKEVESGSRGSDDYGLQDVIKKALVWEFWDKSTREVVWICYDMSGEVLRIDEDLLGLKDFFPCPKPMLAVTTTDTLLPTPEYTIYQDLAQEIDELTDRIIKITKRIKVRGAYNGASEGLADILTAEDGHMIAVNGLDLEFDLSKHVYIVPFTDLIQALNALYQSRNEAKQAMYEVTGISDIVRGQSRASETLGAQRIKSQFATLRIEDRKNMVEGFSREVVSIMSEIIAENFSPESIYYYTGEILDEIIMSMLRSDGLRNANIDVETDSTIAPDEAADQSAMSAMMQSLALVLQQVLPMVQGGMMPLPIAIELMKMVVTPFKGSKELNKLLDKYNAMLTQASEGSPQQGAPGPEGNVVPMMGAQQ
jgi:hypothetical protein